MSIGTLPLGRSSGNLKGEGKRAIAPYPLQISEFQIHRISTGGKRAEESGGSFEITNDMEEAFKDADVVYPKAWTSKHFIPPIADAPMMEKTQELFDANKNWICDAAKMKLAKPDAIYMHCLPCDRGFEVTDEVIDGPNSVVFDEAENRLHVQKAIMALTMDV